jgi:hypothetical protein
MGRRWPAGWLALLVVACASLRAPDCRGDAPSGACTRVLFIGNSYTSVNDLPAVFSRVAAARRHVVYTEMIAPGGVRLADHAASAEVLERIRSGRWNYVVLQEQSQIPSTEQSQTGQMFPAARALVSEIRRAGARPVFYATWARRGGWPENGMPDYASMQAQITQAYRAIGEELHALVAPVGDAWSMVAAERPDIPLWQGDDSHPTEQGTFLAANVLVATLFHEVPQGLGTRGHVPEVQVYALQQAAARAAGVGQPR